MVLACVVTFFAIVAGVNAVMIGAAVSTFGGVDTESSYQAGLAFARESAASRAQDALRWQVDARVSALGDATIVEVTARDAAGKALTGLQAGARLIHPTDRRADHAVVLADLGFGVFKGRTEALAGQWDLAIELLRDGRRIFLSKNRVILQ